MKIGFFTSTFNDRPIEEVLDFAKEAGFDEVEIDANSHIKTADQVGSVVRSARGRGLGVAAITVVGNQNEPDPEKRNQLHARTRDFAAAVGDAKVPVMVIFPGRDSATHEEDNYKAFAGFANALLASTAATGLQLAIENWPGPKNDFIAITPGGWGQLFALIPDKRFGLEFDPSHLLRLGIDPFAALEGVKDRIKILHAKDTSIDRERLQAIGYHGAGWWRYRLPGSGMLDWPKFLKLARGFGFDGTISIEHEDADFGWPRKELNARRQGEQKALGFLRETLKTA